MKIELNTKYVESYNVFQPIWTRQATFHGHVIMHCWDIDCRSNTQFPKTWNSLKPIRKKSIMKLTNKIYDKGCGAFEKGMLIIPTEIPNSYGIIYIYFTFFVGDKNMCLGVTKSILKHGFMIQIHVNNMFK